VRGLNSEIRQREVRSKIDESDYDVICLQETKWENFDWRLIRKFCPKRFNNFVFAPSVGASGGIMILWNSSMFQGTVIEIKRFGIVISFTSSHNNAVWTLVCVYGPCQGVERQLCVLVIQSAYQTFKKLAVVR
jgi:exonuclease III